MKIKVISKSDSDYGKEYDVELLRRVVSFYSSGNCMDNTMRVRFKNGWESSISVWKVEVLEATPEEQSVLDNPEKIVFENGKVKSMEKYTVEFIREKIDTDDRWLVRGLLAIYQRQTAQEKMIQETRERNGVGFNGVDGKIMSSIAEFYMKRQYITPKQMSVVRRKMRKYAGQLTRIANGEA